MLHVLLIVVVGLFGGGVLIALGFLAHLAWYWLSGQDERTPEERAWEAQTWEAQRPGRPLARATSDLS